MTGKLSGSFNLNRFFIPFLMAISATVLKMVTTVVLSLFFGDTVVLMSIASSVFWLEALFTGLCAPIVFALMGLFPTLFLIKGNR